MKAMLVRGALGGSIATAGFLGLTAAVGEFSIVATVVYGVAMTCFFALWPTFCRSADRSAKLS